MWINAQIKRLLARRKDRLIARNLKTIRNAKAVKEDRIGSIDFFKRLPNPEDSVDPLLDRFEYSIDNGIADTREKESAFAGILNHGETVVPYLEKRLQTSSRIAWPIKLLEKLILDKQRLGEILLRCLNFSDVDLTQELVDKNYDILCYLRDYPLSSSTCDQLKHFLNDHDERVRFSVVEALVMQGGEAVASQLEPFLGDSSAENTRIRQSVVTAFLKKGWPISDLEKLAKSSLPAGLYVNNNGKLESQDGI